MSKIGNRPPMPDFPAKAIAYKCNQQHKFKSEIYQNLMFIPKCPKCGKEGMQNRTAEVFMLLASIDDSPEIPKYELSDLIPNGMMPVVEKKAEPAPFNGDAYAMLIAVLTDAGVRMGDGRIGREMCKGCETKLHAPGIKKCNCSCHPAWDFVNEQERKTAKAA